MYNSGFQKPNNNFPAPDIGRNPGQTPFPRQINFPTPATFTPQTSGAPDTHLPSERQHFRNWQDPGSFHAPQFRYGNLLKALMPQNMGNFDFSKFLPNFQPFSGAAWPIMQRSFPTNPGPDQ